MTLIRVAAILLFFCVVATTGSGCARMRVSDGAQGNGADVSNAEPPIGIEIQQAFVSEETLHVSAQLTANRAVPVSALAVTLRGMKDGETLRQSVVGAPSVSAQKALARGDTLHFQLSLEATDLTEYQIEGSWSAGEKSAVESVAAKQGLLLEDLKLSSNPERCYAPPCDMLYVFNGTLRNTETERVGEIVLGLSLNWTERGRTPLIPSDSGATMNEQEIILEQVVIAPGESKPLRIKLDKAVPELVSGTFLPHLRVLRFRSLPKAEPK